MRWSQVSFLAITLVAFTGCGTLHNLKDPPNGPNFLGTGCCYPLGGVTRSGLLAVMGPPGGLFGVAHGNIAVSQGNFGAGFQDIGTGLLLTSAGLIAIADIPLSLAGDILTFPIAYARSREYSWATWWGEESVPGPWPRPWQWLDSGSRSRDEESISDPGTPPAPASDGGDKKSDDGIEPSN